MKCIIELGNWPPSYYLNPLISVKLIHLLQHLFTPAQQLYLCKRQELQLLPVTRGLVL